MKVYADDNSNVAKTMISVIYRVVLRTKSVTKKQMNNCMAEI